MSIIPEKVQEGVTDYELRDDPEYQYRIVKKEVEVKVVKDLELGVEPTGQDLQFLGD